MRGILLRVGCDQTEDGGRWNPPVNIETWDYAYVPIPSDESFHTHIGSCPTYRCFKNSVNRLGTKLPENLSHDRKVHLDPDFESLTIGEPFVRGKLSSRGTIMNELCKGDIIAFYAAFKPIQPGNESNLAYCMFGIFHIERKTYVKNLTADERSRCAHGRRIGAENDLVIWAEYSSSGRFEKAIPIGFYSNGAYRVREDLLGLWGGLKVKGGYIQRSVKPPHFEKADKFLDWLDDVLKGRELLRDNSSGTKRLRVSGLEYLGRFSYSY